MIQELVLIENPNADILCRKYTTFPKLIAVLSQKEYNLARDLSISTFKATKLTKLLFPDKPIGNRKIHHWLLGKYGFKKCFKCEQIKDISKFSSNKSRIDGLHQECKDCDYGYTKINAAANTAAYKAAKIQATVKWANKRKLKEFYQNCPEGFQVDHIVPLRGILVCGLHVENNLQYLTPIDNQSKGNRYELASSNG